MQLHAWLTIFHNMAKVFVALSGGVDSSVAAWLLKKAGYEVIGVFMKFWQDAGFSRQNICYTLESEKRARIVARSLKIPFYIFDFQKEFKKEVVGYFLKQAKQGLTPNPCVVCNKKVKLGLFLEKAVSMGADFIATGHYAKKDFNKGLFRLLKAKDKEKDQSYFLWKLNQNQLAKTLFPIGDYTKAEVRSLARKHKLITARTKESQNLCFLADNANSFLKLNLKMKPGKIINVQGRVIGKHQGLGLYTIGQRQGIIPSLFPKERSSGPYYVLKKDAKKNILILTKKQKDLFSKELLAGNLNFISGKKLFFPLKVKAKIRSRQKEAAGILCKTKKPNQVLFKFKKPERAITPGQTIVFYKNKELLGGGIIN